MSEHLQATVVVPTYGAALYLDAVLRGLAQQDARYFKVIVVDNNATPKHSEASLQEHCPDSTVIHEPRNGLQHARNAGAARSHGAFVAFLDDDSVPSPTWLATLIEGMLRYGAAAAGGTVYLTLHCTPPDWLGSEERALLSELTYAGCDIPRLTDAMYIVGANFGVRRDAFAMAGMFDPAFDRTASSLRSSGELEYTRRLQSNGQIVSFVAAACVSHHIPSARLTTRYFYARSFWQGRSDALLEAKWGRPASFGVRNGRANILALFRKLFGLKVGPTGAERFRSRLALVREWGYYLQATLVGKNTRQSMCVLPVTEHSTTKAT